MVEMMRLFPKSDSEEIVFLKMVTSRMSEEQASNFALSYNEKRRDSTTTVLTTLLAFIGLAGINRFYLGQIGMGVLYLLTGGICGIGTIIDLCRYKTLTTERNKEIANEIAMQASMLDSVQSQGQPAYQPQAVVINNAQPVPVQPNAQLSMSIVCKSGPYAGQQFPVTREGLVIGRDPGSCSVVIQSGMLSRRHARVTLGATPDSILLEDLNSTNGTFVFNNSSWVRITSPVTLTIFKNFRLGSQEVEFEVRS